MALNIAQNDLGGLHRLLGLRHEHTLTHACPPIQPDNGPRSDNCPLNPFGILHKLEPGRSGRETQTAKLASQPAGAGHLGIPIRPQSQGRRQGGNGKTNYGSSMKIARHGTPPPDLGWHTGLF